MKSVFKTNDRVFAGAATAVLLMATLWWEFFGHNFLSGTRGWWIFGDLNLMISGANVSTLSGITHFYTPSATGSLAPPGFIYLLVVLDTIARDFNLTMPLLTASHLRFGQTNAALNIRNHYEYLYGSAAVLLLPCIALASSLPLLAFNEFTSRMGDLRRWQARGGLIIAGCLLFWMSAQWGHPDDAVSIGLLLWGTTKLIDGKIGMAGWLLGASLVMQPVSGLAIPLLIALIPMRKMPGFIGRIVVIPLLAVIPQAIGGWHYTNVALRLQPDDGPFKTPLFMLATPVSVFGSHVANVFVAAAPFRTVSSAAAVLVAGVVFWMVCKGWRPRVDQIAWMMALCLSFRMAVEPVMWPYYVVPALVVACTLAGRISLPRLSVAVLAMALTVVGVSTHATPWLYWMSFLIPLAITILALCPPAAPFVDNRSSTASPVRISRVVAS